MKDCCKVTVDLINPKSLTIGQLYGEYLLEWKDGVMPRLIRFYSNEVVLPSQSISSSSNPNQNIEVAIDLQIPRQNWIVLDGPCDVEWVENLNNALDENHKLCLSNGQILPIHDNIRFIFEVGPGFHFLAISWEDLSMVGGYHYPVSFCPGDIIHIFIVLSDLFSYVEVIPETNFPLINIVLG